jgi:hypothetical protein
MTDTYRILVTGARDWSDEDALAEALLAARDYPLRTIRTNRARKVTLVHGACPHGADAIADRWAKQWGWEVEQHPAEWTAAGKAAGFKRNATMVAAGADICLAFIKPCRAVKPRCKNQGPHDSHGTAHCAKLARAAGILVVEVREQ